MRQAIYACIYEAGGGSMPLLGKGVHPKFVQELLGHATIAITLDTYSHVIPGMGDAIARAMEDTLEVDHPEVQEAEDAWRNGGALVYYWCSEAPGESRGLSFTRSFQRI
jgi:hypothetical protein